MSIDWDQLSNILYILVVLISPAIIGAYKKYAESKEKKERNPNRKEPGLKPEGMLGEKPVEKPKEQENPLLAFFAEMDENEEDEEDGFIITKKKEEESKPKKKVVVNERVIARQKQKEHVRQKVEEDNNIEKQLSLVQERLEKAKQKSIQSEQKAENQTTGKRTSAFNTSSRPASLKKLLVWSEILGPPKALKSRRSSI